MAHKKAGGSSRNGRDSAGRRLGVKKFGGESVVPGNIIMRQRGTKMWPGTGVGMGKDHTIFATVEGSVKFHTGLKGRTFISVLPVAEAAEEEGAAAPSACPRGRRRLLVPMAEDARFARAGGSAAAAPGRVVFGGLTLRRYLRVVDAVARALRAGKASLDRRLLPILERVGLPVEDLRAGFDRMASGSPNF